MAAVPAPSLADPSHGDARSALAQALVAFGQTVALVLAGMLIGGYVIWIGLQMGTRVNRGDALALAILTGCVVGSLAAALGVRLGAGRRGGRAGRQAPPARAGTSVTPPARRPPSHARARP